MSSTEDVVEEWAGHFGDLAHESSGDLKYERELAQHWLQRAAQYIRDARRTEPVNARLLATAKKLEGPIRNTLLHSKPGYIPGTWMPHEDLTAFVAAIAEAERAVAGQPRASLVGSLAALREAGGKAWDAIDDPAKFLGREPEPGADS